MATNNTAAAAPDPAVLLYSCIGPLSSWSFGEPVTTRQGGARVVSIHSSPGEKGAPLVQLAGDGEQCLIAPYGISSPPEGSDRANLELQVTHEPLKVFLRGLDAFFCSVAASKCESWFHKSLREEEVQMLHRPLLSKRTGRVPHDLLRVKVPPYVRVWRVRPSSGGGWVYSLGALEDVARGCSCWVTVSVSSLYFLPRLFGCTLTAQDILVLPMSEDTVPFPFLTTARLVDEAKEEQKDQKEGKEPTTPPVTPLGLLDS